MQGHLHQSEERHRMVGCRCSQLFYCVRRLSPHVRVLVRVVQGHLCQSCGQLRRLGCCSQLSEQVRRTRAHLRMLVVQGRLHSREQRRVLGGRRSQLLQGSHCPRTDEPVRIMQSRLHQRRGHFRMPSCRCPDPPERLCCLCPHQFIPVMQG